MSTNTGERKLDNWCCSEFEISTAELEWNVQVPCLETTTQWMDTLDSTLFFTKSNPYRKWKMQLTDMGTDLNIQLFLTTQVMPYYNKAKIDDPVRVKIAILDSNRHKTLQLIEVLPRASDAFFNLRFSKAEILKSNCQQLNGSLTFYCELESYRKKEPVSGQTNNILSSPMPSDGVEQLGKNPKVESS